jgi:Phage integrase family
VNARPCVWQPMRRRTATKRGCQSIRNSATCSARPRKGARVDSLLLPGSWVNRSAEMLQGELQRAGVAYIDGAGRYRDFHALRHRFATKLAEAEVPVSVAQSLMRHSTSRLTMDVYTHTDPRAMVEALDRLPHFPSSPLPGTEEIPRPEDTSENAFPIVCPIAQTATGCDGTHAGVNEPDRASERKPLKRRGLSHVDGVSRIEAPGGFEPPVEVLQTSALPLGYGAGKRSNFTGPGTSSQGRSP